MIRIREILHTICENLRLSKLKNSNRFDVFKACLHKLLQSSSILKSISKLKPALHY